MQRLYKWIRSQNWLYDIGHDSLLPRYRRIAFFFLRIAARVHAIRYTFVPPSWKKDERRCRLNLGSGREPLPEWINVDLNPFSGAELWLDIGGPWPFGENEVDAIYIRHCLEHFTEPEVLSLLGKCYKVLGPGKGIRVGVPSLEFAIQQYQNADFSFVPWVIDHAKSPGRQFYSYIMDNGNHEIIFDYGYLAELLELSGFTCIERAIGGRSSFLGPCLLSAKDNPGDVATLYVEGRK